MRRATLDDAGRLNAILNDPAVAPGVMGNGRLDASSVLKNPNNRCYLDDRGGAMFLWTAPGIYEGHSFFIVRGREAIRAGRECLAHMTDATAIWGATPLGNRAARWFNRQLGFKSHGEIDTPDYGRCELFSLEN